MKNDFADRIKKIELELLALKTASLYTFVRASYTAYSGRVQTGLYKIDYETSGEGIISFFYTDKTQDNVGGVYPRTPQGSSQIVEVNTTYYASGAHTTYTLSFLVVSNVPVINITKIA